MPLSIALFLLCAAAIYFSCEYFVNGLIAAELTTATAVDRWRAQPNNDAPADGTAYLWEKYWLRP
jgi:hypothetical protein